MQQSNDNQSPQPGLGQALKLRLQETRLLSSKLEAETPPPPGRVIPYLVITEPVCGFGLTVWETLLAASDTDALALALEGTDELNAATEALLNDSEALAKELEQRGRDLNDNSDRVIAVFRLAEANSVLEVATYD